MKDPEQGLKELLERQAEWQKSRKDLSWPEKVRIVERMRDDVQKLRAAATSVDGTSIKAGKPNL